MNTPNLSTLRMLRESQARAAREQQIFSGRDWLFVSALVQFLTALHPIYRCVMELLGAGDFALIQHDFHTALGMLSMSLLLLVLWNWAKYAPFRAAFVALAFYVALQTCLAIYDPQHVLYGLASKVIVLAGLVIAVRVGYRRRHSE